MSGDGSDYAAPITLDRLFRQVMQFCVPHGSSENNVTYRTTRELWLSYGRFRPRIVSIPPGTLVTLWNFGKTTNKLRAYIGTVFMNDIQLSLRFDGKPECRNLEKIKQQAVYFGTEIGRLGMSKLHNTDESVFAAPD